MVVNWREHEWRWWITEALGTFWLVFLHAGLSIISRTDANPDPVRRLSFGGQAMGVGLSLVLLIYSYGGLSGAQVPGYWLSQGVGAMTAAGALWGFFGGDDAQLGSNYPEGLLKGSPERCFFLEFLLSFLLQSVALLTASRAMSVGANAALAVGATLGVCTLVGGPFGGGSMNPWRSFAPGILAPRYRGWLWIYCCAPLAAAPVTALVRIVFREGKVEDGERTAATGEGETEP
ncbi:aquaporin-like protein [Hyaloraphidium curvatum]|nr:aquaporin-like protein [Hyaloraphidium curvatum]